MRSERTSMVAHRMIDDTLHTSRRRFLTQVGAACLAIGAPVSTTRAQETQHSSVGDGNQVSLGEKLARYAASLRYEDLPEDVIQIAKRTILDTIGCAFGGYSAGPSKIAMKLASAVTSKRPGTILLSGIKTSPELAVFANGVMIRYLDFNDAYVSQTNGAGHPSDAIAALLTAGELRQLSGRDLITATVLAYEVYCKIGDVFDYLGHGVDHTTVTGMAAVVGAGKLLGLTPEDMVHAIGITVGGNTATRQGRADTLSNWKAYAAADACRKAIFSVQLAGNGMTGPSNVFEGRYGFFKVMSRKPVAPPQLGEPFGIRRCFTKHLANLPAKTDLRTLATTIKARWVCEQAHQQMKEELGLDHFEGRSWQGLHRHALMTMIAYAFLQHRRLATARREKKNQWAAASANFARRTPRHSRTLRSTTAAAMPALSNMDLQRAAA